MPLVIVESPAKCSKIKGFLGPGYDVIASMGHIRALEEGLEGIGKGTARFQRIGQRGGARNLQCGT